MSVKEHPSNVLFTFAVLHHHVSVQNDLYVYFVMLHTNIANAATPLIKDNYKHFCSHHLLYDSFQPPRSAHPNVKFTCTSQEPMVIENLPFDKYEMEPSPLTQFILARKQPTVCWQVNYKNNVLVI